MTINFNQNPGSKSFLRSCNGQFQPAKKSLIYCRLDQPIDYGGLAPKCLIIFYFANRFERNNEREWRNNNHRNIF